MQVFRTWGAAIGTSLLLTAVSACSSSPPSEPLPLTTDSVSRASGLLQGAPTPAAHGRDLFTSEEDHRLVTTFVRDASTLFGGDTQPHPERCADTNGSLRLDAPPDDLFEAAGRLRDDTTRTLLLEARSQVGRLLSRCLAGKDVDRTSWDAGRTSLALVQARLTQAGVSVP